MDKQSCSKLREKLNSILNDCTQLADQPPHGFSTTEVEDSFGYELEAVCVSLETALELLDGEEAYMELQAALKAPSANSSPV